MRWPLTNVSVTVDWVSVAFALLLVVILLAVTLPLWTPDVFGHLWH